MSSAKQFKERDEATAGLAASDLREANRGSSDHEKENEYESRKTYSTTETTPTDEGETAEAGWMKLSDRLSELKETAMDTGRRARGFLTGRKEKMKQKTPERTETAGETEEEIRSQLEKVKLRAKNEDPESIRGSSAKRTIRGALPSVTEAIRLKLTQPTDIVEETRAAHERGGTGRKNVGEVVPGTRPHFRRPVNFPSGIRVTPSRALALVETPSCKLR